MIENRRLCGTVDLDALRYNARVMHERCSADTDMLAVIKADAYGHGAVPCAFALRELPFVKGFAVATPEEALSLRAAGVREKILILGIVFPEALGELIRQDVTLTAASAWSASAIREAALREGRRAHVFAAVDTGMGRIGFRPDREGAKEIAALDADDSFCLDGIFTHYAAADSDDLAGAYAQLDKMRSLLSVLGEDGVRPPVVSTANSAAVFVMPEAHFGLVRAGVSLYGMMPSAETGAVLAKEGIRLRPVLSVVSHITHVKEIAAGDTVSYGGTYAADGPRVIATVPAGYADGYPRGLSNKGHVLFRGKKAPVRGRVCMDQFMIDVTGLGDDIRPGEEVVLLGEQGEERITAEQLGEISGRFNYELTSLLGKRVQKVFREGGKIKSMQEYGVTAG